MKKVSTLSSLLLILTLLIASCGKDPKIEQDLSGATTGRFSLQLGTMGSFEVVTKASKSVDVNDFTVRVKGTTLKETSYDSTWLRYSDMPAVITIPAGTYTISAYNGEQQSGFDSPYYYGEKEFMVGIQELTDAQVTCQLACVKLSVEFTSLFLSNVTDPVCIIHQTDGVSLEFEPEDSNVEGYIAAPADSTLAVTIRGRYTEDNTEVDRTYFIKSVGAKQWHKIALSVNTSAGIENGGGMIQIDHSVDEKESTVLIPGSDDLIDNNGDSGSWDDEEEPDKPVNPDGDLTNGPTIDGTNFNGSAFSFDNPLTITDAEKEAGITLQVNLTAVRGGIQHLYLTMSSTDKIEGGLNQMFEGLGATDESNPWDLANPDQSLSAFAKETLTNLNVIDSQDPIKGKTEYLFSIGAFMTFLTSPDNAGYFEHTFNITVVDGEGHSVKKVLAIRRSVN